MEGEGKGEEEGGEQHGDNCPVVRWRREGGKGQTTDRQSLLGRGLGVLDSTHQLVF